MLRMFCNRCKGDLGVATGIVSPAGASQITIFKFDKQNRKLVRICEIDLCEACSDLYSKLVLNWLPEGARPASAPSKGPP